MEEKLPIYSKNQKVGNRSETFLQFIMEKFCIITAINQNQDFGIDFSGTVLDDSHPKEYNFNVQCKGTDSCEIWLDANGTTFSYPVKTSTINYWKQKQDVTFLFIVDLKNEQIYWTAPLKEIENKDLSGQDTYTFHIPKTNCLDSSSEALPESFIFEIMRYYADYSETIIQQLDRVQNYSTDNIKNMLEIMEILEKSFRKVDVKYKETINKLIEKIKYDLNRSISYCYQLENMNDIVLKYCPKGILNTAFDTGKENKTIGDIQDMINDLISREKITYNELYELSKEVSHFRGNFLGFYREMVYEDRPFANHDDIDKEFFDFFK